ncbi:hypothetical protein IMCC3317_46260 [Kordia antarctica]|uniref:DUF5689 domain-containing protein n=1 Tax=Kordia antarctica TaxID=1218801 RepID=A0A7L4ZRS4_9FLAO|nr:hypothetical protein [Kordia antarctica]QHI39221.1 hypothetical protein IMCC3317_46260 [Kordia antarctica]
MKAIKITILALALVLVWNCSKDDYQDYEAPDTLSDVSWVIGLNRTSQEPFSINYDTHISFFDLSQGAVSHEWQIQQGNHFLVEDLDPTDTLTNYIDEAAGLIIGRPKAHVFFRNSGENTVRLLNKFSEPVSYNSSAGPFNSVQEGNLHVIDTTFTFDVYAQIKPAFKVLQDGVEILTVTEDEITSIDDIDTWPTVDVEAGTSLTFMDLTETGRPNGRSWRFPEGTPNQVGGITANVSFFQLGTFTGELRSFRIAPQPNAQETKVIPLKVNVVPSSQPFVFSNNLTEAENEKISFQVNGEVTPFSGEEGSFTVNVMNTASGFNQVIPVQLANVQAADATFIELTLSQPIYNSDLITVSYNGTNITSSDTRVLQPFGPETVAMFFGDNILPGNGWASFELTGGGVNNAYASSQYFIPGGQGNGQFGDLVWERVTTNAADGAASMQYNLPNVSPIPNMNLFGFSFAKPNGIPAGTYKVSYKVFKESSTLNAFRMEFGNPVTDIKVFDISTINNNQWVEVSETIVFTADLPTNYRTTLRVIAGDNPGVTGAQLLYFDDLSLIELEPRP